jgi:hypothetical protein
LPEIVPRRFTGNLPHKPFKKIQINSYDNPKEVKGIGLLSPPPNSLDWEEELK